ncbi:hypothetical protein DDE82_006923 [Stemphylium lycopersici]|uniref:UBC core domain-containing protein n=1 Tax=Stemphylium lycopersici TaxID=183478 RepID=A0A364MTQ7_STELY|nr:hypothetical protein DDE82_006923 [Stemphylium lycopersici]RAR02846.1 hypothetical protein DDE83_008446 [Stemphylium lycopersici]
MPLSGSASALPSFRKQHLLVEFSRLRYAQLEGVFLSITPGDPSLWVGVIFVRKGPYAPAVLRFQISFPPSYPAIPPLVTFSTDVFHPLLTPLTTYTYTTGSADTDTVSATDEERLPPGGFSLRHGFPHWFGRARKSVPNSRNVSGSALGSPARPEFNVTPSALGAPSPTEEISIVRMLEYIRSTFSEESILDSLPLEAAANPGAYHAWRAHRAPILQAQQASSASPSPEPSTTEKSEGSSALGRNRRPGEWNWEGVWEDRVRKAVKASLSEPVLFGTGAGEDIQIHLILVQQEHLADDILFPHTPLYPSPLHIQKKSRKATFRRRIFHKSAHNYGGDDFDPSVLDWACPLKTPLSWSATPLPVSRTPSDHPLTIRKNRNSRSSASGSGFGDLMADSRNNSQDEASNAGRSSHIPSSVPWPPLDTISNESVHVRNFPAFISAPQRLSAQQSLEIAVHNTEGRNYLPKRRKSSRLRLFTGGLPLLRRQGTGDTSLSAGDSSDTTTSPIVGTPLAAHDEIDEGVVAKDLSEDAVMAFLAKNVRKSVEVDPGIRQILKLFSGEKFKSLMDRFANHIPPPTECDQEVVGANAPISHVTLPTTLRAAVRLFPEVKVLRKEVQEITIAVDIEGVLHNRRLLADDAIDVIILVDNGYYVTAACLEKSLEAVNGALYHLGSGDRLALYTTHCTHRSVTGNRPDMLYPMRSINNDTGSVIRELTSTIAQSGTQVWDPPRPNPSMTDVILGIARSVEAEHLKAGRTHIIVLSPAAHTLHDVSKSFPDLYIHRINPAILPYHREPEFQDKVCLDSCCKNVFASNYFKYQSTPSRVKRILKNARSYKPVGELTKLSVNIRTKTGCELIEFYGDKEIPQLYLGQVHTLFVRIRVTKAEAQSIKLDSENPILNSSIDANGLRQDLLNSVHLGATKLHLFDVQVLHRNSIHEAQAWNYTESPLILTSELGGLALPQDALLEVYRRQYFYSLTQIGTNEAKLVAEDLLHALPEDSEQAKKLIERMVKEIECHLTIREYERKYRQKLPLCPGPIEIETSHQWLIELWDRRKNKCECIDTPERLI